MWPEILHLRLPFELPIIGHDLRLYSYGLMLVIGFLLSVELAKFLARRAGLDPETFANGAMIALFTGVIGARISHIFENWHEFTRQPDFLDNLRNMLNLRSGGLTFYGGLLLAFPLTVLYGVYKKVPIPRAMDVMAPCIVLGLAIGRIGCFLNGCCYGAECNLPWAVHFPYGSNAYVEQVENNEIHPAEQLVSVDDYSSRQHPISVDEAKRDPQLWALAAKEKSLGVHPAQLYSTLTSLLVAAILVAYFSLAPRAGLVMALMLVLEGATRFLLEMVRAEPPIAPNLFGSMTLSMIIGIALVFAGAIMWLIFRREPHARKLVGFPMKAIIPSSK